MVSRLFAVFALVCIAYGQNYKPAATASIKPIVNITNNEGLKIEFSITEARVLYDNLMLQTNPALPENAYMGTKLLEALAALRSNRMYIITDEGFPLSWNQGSRALAFANSNYCGDRRYPTAAPTPCVTFFPNLLMISMRTYVPMLRQPDRAMKNSFAVYQAHEVVHIARGPEFFAAVIPPEAAALEEVRGWYQTVISFVEPLRAKGEPLWGDLIDMSDKLRTCRLKLPCKPFEDFVRSNKTVQ